ncbi:type II toxin-antitoxin system HicA family toxin [Clavibacter michiganensis]|nr:type II toxin-antitoxin system HicA family toxin [Clavibacter michiganensis]
MKDAKRSEVEAFLRAQGYTVKRDKGPHTFWAKEGCPSIPLPRHTTTSAGVLRGIEKTIGHVPDEWK